MNGTTKSWLFVAVQAFLLGLLIFAKDSTASSPRALHATGNIITLLGVIILLVSLYDLRKSLTVLPLPKKHGVMQVRGLYRFVRHPMYVGVLVLSLGIVVPSGSITKCGIFAALYVLFSLKARYEERLLIDTYPGYKVYMAKTPRFLPKVRI